jgi:hypothetical protein
VAALVAASAAKLEELKTRIPEDVAAFSQEEPQKAMSDLLPEYMLIVKAT